MDIGAIEKAVNDYLSGQASLTSLLADPDNVLLGRAPGGAGVELPAVEIDFVSSTEDTQRPRAVGVSLQIKAIAKTAATANEIATKIDSLMQDHQFTDFGSYNYANYGTYALHHLFYNEETEAVTYWHAGATYLILVEEL